MVRKDPAWLNDKHTQYKVFAVLGDMDQDMASVRGVYDDAISAMKELRNKSKGWTQWELRRKITDDKFQTVYITHG
jgi:hypothetical protein